MEKLLPIILSVIWIGWGFSSYKVITLNIVENEVYSKEGFVIGSKCVGTRNGPYLRLSVDYNGDIGNVSLDVPYDLYPYGCKSTISMDIINKPIHITKYQNIKLGVKIGDIVFQSEKEEINFYRSNNGTLVWLTFSALMLTLSFLVIAGKIKWIVELRKKRKKVG